MKNSRENEVTKWWQIDDAWTMLYLACAIASMCGTQPAAGTVTCPPGAIHSIEPCPDPVDDYCDELQDLPLGGIACGTLTGNEINGVRDLDRWRIDLSDMDAPISFQASVDAAFSVGIALYRMPSGDCDPGTLPTIAAGGIGSVDISICVQDPDLYYLRVWPLLPFDLLGTFQNTLLLTCDGPNEYVLSATAESGSPRCGTTCPQSDVHLTQNLLPDVLEWGSAACPAGFDATGENSFARSYDLKTDRRTFGQQLHIECVQVAMDAVSEPGFQLHVRIWHDLSGGAPDVASLELLASRTVSVGTVWLGEFVGVPFDPPVMPQIDSTIVVELHWDAQPIAAYPGGNFQGQTAPLYFRSASTCGIPEFVDFASLGFPDQATIIDVHGRIVAAAAAAADLIGPGDGQADGVVDGLDLAMLLEHWTGTGKYSPCPPRINADIVGSREGPPDCSVNGFDLAFLLASWTNGR